MFPADRPEKLQDLKSIIDLLTSITFFRLKMQDLDDAPRSPTIVKQCVQECQRQTYRMLYENCATLHNKLVTIRRGSIDNDAGCRNSNATENPLDFWHKLMQLIMFAIEEDKCCYEPVLNQ